MALEMHVDGKDDGAATMPVIKVSLSDEDLAKQMGRIRTWLDDRRYTPVEFRYRQAKNGLTVHVQFTDAKEADEFARQFSGRSVAREREGRVRPGGFVESGP